MTKEAELSYSYEAGGVRAWMTSTQGVKVPCGLYYSMEEAKTLERDSTLVSRMNGGWNPLHKFIRRADRCMKIVS